jgi:hypothetical protein
VTGGWAVGLLREIADSRVERDAIRYSAADDSLLKTFRRKIEVRQRLMITLS